MLEARRSACISPLAGREVVVLPRAIWRVERVIRPVVTQAIAALLKGCTACPALMSATSMQSSARARCQQQPRLQLPRSLIFPTEQHAASPTHSHASRTETARCQDGADGYIHVYTQCSQAAIILTLAMPVNHRRPVAGWTAKPAGFRMLLA